MKYGKYAMDLLHAHFGDDELFIDNYADHMLFVLPHGGWEWAGLAFVGGWCSLYQHPCKCGPVSSSARCSASLRVCVCERGCSHAIATPAPGRPSLPWAGHARGTSLRWSGPRRRRSPFRLGPSPSDAARLPRSHRAPPAGRTPPLRSVTTSSWPTRAASTGRSTPTARTPWGQ